MGDCSALAVRFNYFMEIGNVILKSIQCRNEEEHTISRWTFSHGLSVLKCFLGLAVRGRGNGVKKSESAFKQFSLKRFPMSKRYF